MSNMFSRANSIRMMTILNVVVRVNGSLDELSSVPSLRERSGLSSSFNIALWKDEKSFNI